MPRADGDLDVVAECAQAVFELRLADVAESAAHQQRELGLRDRHSRRRLALGQPQLGDRLLDAKRELGLDHIAGIEPELSENAAAGRCTMPFHQ